MLYGVKWYILLLLGCFSDIKDQVSRSGQTVWPSSADQNRTISSINAIQLKLNQFCYWWRMPSAQTLQVNCLKPTRVRQLVSNVGALSSRVHADKAVANWWPCSKMFSYWSAWLVHCGSQGLWDFCIVVWSFMMSDQIEWLSWFSAFSAGLATLTQVGYLWML